MKQQQQQQNQKQTANTSAAGNPPNGHIFTIQNGNGQHLQSNNQNRNALQFISNLKAMNNQMQQQQQQQHHQQQNGHHFSNSLPNNQSLFQPQPLTNKKIPE